jgi:hypothetical protein
MTMTRVLGHCMTCAALLSVLPSPGQAQAAQSAQERAIRAEAGKLRFTMAELRAWYAAQTALAQYQHDHPDQELAEEDYESLAAFQQKLDANSEFSRILKASRLTSRQFALLTAAWGLATLAESKVRRGATPAVAAREAGTSVENVNVLAQNAAELRELQKKLDAASGVD